MIRNTAHIMLISNFKRTPMVYLVQERNKCWGIFGGGQEKVDNNSFIRTAIRELQEETCDSIIGNPSFFKYLDNYLVLDKEGNIHKTLSITYRNSPSFSSVMCYIWLSYYF